MSRKPTNAELDTAKDVLSWLLDEMREHMPQAFNSIAVVEETLMEIPTTIEEFEDDCKEAEDAPRRKVTAEMLGEVGACDSELLRRFKRRWPNGAYVTRKNCLVVAGWDTDALTWAHVPLLFSPLQRRTPGRDVNCEYCDAVKKPTQRWCDAGNPKSGKVRRAYTEAQADAFWKMAKGILR